MTEETVEERSDGFFRREPSQGNHRTAFIKGRRTPFPGNVEGGVCRFVDPFLRLLKYRQPVLLRDIQSDPADLHSDGDKDLLRIVVEKSRKAPSLPLFDRTYFGDQTPQTHHLFFQLGCALSHKRIQKMFRPSYSRTAVQFLAIVPARERDLFGSRR